MFAHEVFVSAMASYRLVKVTFLWDAKYPVTFVCFPIDFRIVSSLADDQSHYICGIINQPFLIKIRADQLQAIELLEETFDPDVPDDL